MLCAGTIAFAQHSVKGTVVDQSGLPVIGLSVIEVGTSNGTVTDVDGNYAITVSGGAASLEFNALGYATVTEVVNDRAVINVTMQDDAIMLDAVVAIGYGTAKKRDLTTAITVVNTDDMKMRPVAEASGFIQGKVAGVTVQQTSGTPGAGMTVRVRGASSIASSNDPLYVVDGVPVGTGSYAIAYLSPNDIETMQILKDASSAAIYGSRAANGVVLITTKQGKKSKGAQINFSGFVGVTNVAKTYDVLNVQQYADLMQDVGALGADKIAEIKGLKDETDWFDETYKTGINQNYQLSVSNGNDKMRYYLSGGYSDEKGILDVAYAKRFNVKASFDSDLFNWISVGANVAYSHYKSNGIISGTGSNRAGVVLSVINTPTYAKPWSEIPGEEGWYWTDFKGANLTTPSENLARTADNYSQTDRLLLTGHATIKFHKNLNLKSSVTMDRRWVHDFSFLDPNKTSYGRTQHGEASSARSDDMRMVYDNILTFNYEWDGKHTFEAMGGTSATTSRWENLSGSRSHFTDDRIWGLNGGNKGGLRGNSQGYSEWAIMSYLGRVSYNYDSKYYVTVNFRADGSSKLARGHRWGYFPSASAAWRLSGENWLKDVSWLSDLKLRVGWGQQGNQSGLGDHAWIQTYNVEYYDWTQSEYADATPGISASRPNLGNVDLTWETTTQTNVGIDFSVLNSRLTFTLDAYYKYTKNLLMNVPLPSPYPNLTRNEGEMSNKGIELAISSVNIDRNDWNWTTDFNISTNKNMLEKLDLQTVYYYTSTSEVLSEQVVRMTPGMPLSQFWGYKDLGVDPETGMMVYEDLNGDGKINVADKQYIGDANPDFTFGMNNNISWKGLNLSFLITGSYGNDIYNASKLEMIGMYNGGNQITDVINRWRAPGQITDIPKAGAGSVAAHNLRASTRWIEDGSYLKVKNITLSYNIEHPALKKANISRIQPYITLDNMITLTKYTGYDPEMSQYSSATSMGIDWGTYPCVKSVIFGVNVDF